MRLFHRLPVMTFICRRVLIGGCSGGDAPQVVDGSINAACRAQEDPEPPTPFDEASRLESVQAEIQRLLESAFKSLY